MSSCYRDSKASQLVSTTIYFKFFDLSLYTCSINVFEISCSIYLQMFIRQKSLCAQSNLRFLPTQCATKQTNENEKQIFSNPNLFHLRLCRVWKAKCNLFEQCDDASSINNTALGENATFELCFLAQCTRSRSVV